MLWLVIKKRQRLPVRWRCRHTLCRVTPPKAWNSLADLATCPGTAASSWSRIATAVC